MAAPAIVDSVRFSARGASLYVFCAAVANTAAPTRAEINAGTNLARQVADAEGWNVESEQIDTPDLASRYTSTIPGTISAAASTLTMYASRNGVDARALMPRDATGFMLVLDGGDVPGGKMEVYPVTVSSVSKQRSVSGEEADTLLFTFAITSVPSENVTIPA